MRYYRLVGDDGRSRVAVENERGVLLDLTSIDASVSRIEDLASAAFLSQSSIDQVSKTFLSSGNPDSYSLDSLIDHSRETPDYGIKLGRPFDPPEVWAAGVTYKTSEMERRRESQSPDIYSRVYAADRPELFLKATAARCVGPFQSIGIRGDSEWNVPEPELAFVIYGKKIIGYTAGNDVSSRSIEGENPLYLPQAKLYTKSCSIGPCFATPNSVPDPQNVAISCTVLRQNQEVFVGQTHTSLMSRKCEDLALWLQKHNAIPNMTTVLTGTSIVPPPDFTLERGDIVIIAVEGVGALENKTIIV